MRNFHRWGEPSSQSFPSTVDQPTCHDKGYQSSVLPKKNEVSTFITNNRYRKLPLVTSEISGLTTDAVFCSYSLFYFRSDWVNGRWKVVPIILYFVDTAFFLGMIVWCVHLSYYTCLWQALQGSTGVVYSLLQVQVHSLSIYITIRYNAITEIFAIAHNSSDLSV